MFDRLQVILWSITYVLIIYNGYRYRGKHPLLMPYFVGGLNFAWELNALIVSNASWGHVLWLSLDCLILALNFRNLSAKKKNYCMYYLIYTLVGIAVFFAVFRAPNIDGMLISSYILDLLIALEYILVAKKISHHGKIQIAICKLLGDVFAWIFYFNQSALVRVLGGLVFVINLFYVAFCIEEKERRKKNNGRR